LKFTHDYECVHGALTELLYILDLNTRETISEALGCFDVINRQEIAGSGVLTDILLK
jgi:hypothetical protein